MIETRFRVLNEPDTELPGADLPAPPAVGHFICFAGHPHLWVVLSVTWMLALVPEAPPVLVVLLKKSIGPDLPTRPEQL